MDMIKRPQAGPKIPHLGKKQPGPLDKAAKRGTPLLKPPGRVKNGAQKGSQTS